VRRIACLLILSFALCVGGLSANPSSKLGPVTKLPLPRFVSLKAAEGNVRRGPSLSHRIDWVFKRRNMPLLVTAEHGHWRRVQDRDGAGGWVHYALISGNRTVLVDQDMLALHRKPDAQSHILAALEAGVIAELGECMDEWCYLSSGGYRGWAKKSALWGVAPK
jgi:SH3-like domain-containing protein